MGELQKHTNSLWNKCIESMEDAIARQFQYFYLATSKEKADTLLKHARIVVGRVVRFLTGHTFLLRHNAIVAQGNPFPVGDLRC